ncbi:MAG: four-helix bundle copper-binding protein [Verrucomicrobiota bacterium]
MAHEKYQSCIDACHACATECEHCASACLKEEDVQNMTRCIELDWDCALICAVAAKFMARDSEFAETICRQCAEICRACGEECRKHQVDHCQRCADACEKCAEECERMAGAMAHGV